MNRNCSEGPVGTPEYRKAQTQKSTEVTKKTDSTVSNPRSIATSHIQGEIRVILVNKDQVEGGTPDKSSM